jgi:hypothetical protein
MMTATKPRERTTGWELAQRTRIEAFRAGRYVLILAEGELPTPGYDVDVQQSPIRIFPPQFNLLRRERPGAWPDVVRPYRYAEVVPYPPDQSVVTVHHRDGVDDVEIQACGEDLAEFATAVGDRQDQAAGPAPREATGMSRKLSFDEAFADALSNLPPAASQHPDQLTSVVVTETGGLFGGIAGFHHLYVRIRGSSD